MAQYSATSWDLGNLIVVVSPFVLLLEHFLFQLDHPKIIDSSNLVNGKMAKSEGEASDDEENKGADAAAQGKISCQHVTD